MMVQADSVAESCLFSKLGGLVLWMGMLLGLMAEVTN